MLLRAVKIATQEVDSAQIVEISGLPEQVVEFLVDGKRTVEVLLRLVGVPAFQVQDPQIGEGVRLVQSIAYRLVDGNSSFVVLLGLVQVTSLAVQNAKVPQRASLAELAANLVGNREGLLEMSFRRVQVATPSPDYT